MRACVRACVRVCVREGPRVYVRVCHLCLCVGARAYECGACVFIYLSKFNTGMGITCVYTSFYGFICDSVRLLHVTSDVIRTIVVRRRPNRMLTYVIT